MAIVFGADAGVRQNATYNYLSGIVDQFKSLSGSLSNAFSTIANANLPVKERIYVDTGYENVPGTSFAGSQQSALQDFKQRNIVTQEPQATVFIKKRAFSALRSENDTRFSDDADKLYLRATKILFENKCNQIAAYEAVTKVQQILSEETPLDISRIEILLNMVSTINDNFLSTANAILTNPNTTPDQMAQTVNSIDSFNSDNKQILTITSALDNIKKQVLKQKQATTTTWVIDPENNTDIYNVGRGSGVIELTLISDISTSLSIDDNGSLGSFNFSMQDPYHLTNINKDDIEIALAAAYNEAADVSVSGSNANLLSSINQSAQTFLTQARAKEELLRTTRNSRLNNIFGGGLTGNTGQGEINFSINVSSTGPNAVTGSVAGYNSIFNSSNYNIVLAQLDEAFRLTPTENNLVSTIFNLLQNYVTYIQRQSNLNTTQKPTADLMYARRQMTLHYLGKGIIQPMDGVYVFFRSKTAEQNQMQGPISSLLNNTTFMESFVQNYLSNEDQLQAELENFGLDKLGISPDLYKLLRSQSFLRNAGTCVFGGLVDIVSERYNASAGSYTTDISGTNNLKYLQNSRVNTSPSLDQSRSFLEDPLTPFDLNIDPATGLIVGTPQFNQSNVNRIKNQKLAFSNGTYSGQMVDPSSSPADFMQDYSPFNGTNLSKYEHVPGLVYKWKTGIVSISANINLKNSLNGTSLDTDVFKREIGQTVVTDPFANADVADVCSLVVTGFPHNYEAFVINSQIAGTYTFGDDSNSPISYFHRFFDIQRSLNRAFGNFLPFKPLKIDGDQLAARLKLQVHLTQSSEELTRLQSQQATLQDQINVLSANQTVIQNSDAVTNARRSASLAFLNNQLDSISSQISEKLSNMQATLANSDTAGYANYGSNINNSLNGQTAVSLSDSSAQSDTTAKNKLQYMQLRTQLGVKYNTDTNLFIVDDAYDKDADIQTFVLNLRDDPDFFNSTFKTPLDICIEASKVINYEFFCDTQGHVNLRPPQYNKTPLTILLRMFALNTKNSTQVFPPFLAALFNSQLQSFQDQSSLLALNIQQAAALLNVPVPQPSDSTMAQLANISNLDLVSKTTQGQPASTPVNAAGLLSINNQIAAIDGTPATEANQQNLDALTKTIAMYQDPNLPNTNANRLTKLEDLKALVSQKQQVDLKIHKLQDQQNAINSINSQESVNFSTTIGGRNQALAILQPFSDIIEDDITDTIGPGSSKRFIITDDMVMDYSFVESDAGLSTRIDVTGTPPLIGEGSSGNLAGVPTIWAGATDFDLWRQYGWRADGAVNIPFFRDSELQCAPYALMLLSRQRKDVVRGTITVVGNEYYQLGDVVYVTAKNLLYYVTSVSHTFSYSGTFTTTLTLHYGHPVGEYIPSPLDVIGKNLIKNYRGFNRNLQNRITADQKKGVLLGVVSFPDSMKNNSDTEDTLQSKMLTSDVGKLNLAALKNALLTANIYVTDTATYPKIELRGYYSNDNDLALTQSRLNVVKNWFISPNDGAVIDSGGNQLFAPLNTNTFKYLSDKNFTANSTVPVDFTGDTISKEDQDAGRIPKEELRNVSSVGSFSEGIEIVLVYNG